MPTHSYAQAARRDLVEIHSYTLKVWSEEQADTYIDHLDQCCADLARMPGIGRTCNYLSPGLRRFECREHVIFYQQQGNVILIARILHKRMLADKARFSP